jgi:SPP1 family predicted phage head-tail adaptor
MLAGKLKDRITFERADVARNGYGEEISTWVPVITMWASVSHISGRELLISNREGAENTYRIRVRDNPGLEALSPKWRIRYRESILNIVQISDRVDRELEIMADADASGG